MKLLWNIQSGKGVTLRRPIINTVVLFTNKIRACHNLFLDTSFLFGLATFAELFFFRRLSKGMDFNASLLVYPYIGQKGVFTKREGNRAKLVFEFVWWSFISRSVTFLMDFVSFLKFYFQYNPFSFFF